MRVNHPARSWMEPCGHFADNSCPFSSWVFLQCIRTDVHLGKEGHKTYGASHTGHVGRVQDLFYHFCQATNWGQSPAQALQTLSAKGIIQDVSVNPASVPPLEAGSWFSFGKLFLFSLSGHVVWVEWYHLLRQYMLKTQTICVFHPPGHSHWFRVGHVTSSQANELQMQDFIGYMEQWMLYIY